MEFNNKSGLEFTDISSEEYREYLYITEESAGYSFRISNPLYLHVSDSGGHRVFDADGVSHYVPPKWIKLQWKAKEGQPHFVK